jgi:hypothetical protein
MSQKFQLGVSLRRAEQLWRENGGTVEMVHRTGEMRFRHSTMARCILVNSRVKDANAKLVTALNRICAEPAQEAPK